MPTLKASALQLRFVPLDRLLVHEETDPFRVKRLQRSLSREGKLRNPPIVTGHGEHYVVLDGATRTMVLEQMGFRDALVQIVDITEGTVELNAWHHIVSGLAPNRLLAKVSEKTELVLEAMEWATAQQRLTAREILACLILCDGRVFSICCGGDLHCQAEQLCRLVAIYRGKAEVRRTTHPDLPTLIEQYPDLSAIIVFPRFQPHEIIEIALKGGKVPMGITRHVISGRALGLDIPIEMLTSSQSLEAKNEWLSELIRQRLQANKIRLYEEPVFVFDD